MQSEDSASEVPGSAPGPGGTPGGLGGTGGLLEESGPTGAAPAAVPEPSSDLVDIEDWPALRGPRAMARLVFRSLAMPSLSCGMFVWYLGGLPVRSAAGRTRWRNRMIRAWGRAMLRTMGGRLAVQGAPPGPSLVVSNHLSYVDIVALASSLPTVFVSKAEVARWPGIGILARFSGTIFVQRENKRDLPKAAGRIASELENGSGVVLFPEGTSGPGRQLLPFRPSLLDPAARGELEVAFAAVSYRTPAGCPPASQVVCWWGDMPFGGHVTRLLRLPYFEAEIRFGPETLRGSDRKDLSSRLWHAVKVLFEPTL